METRTTLPAAFWGGALLTLPALLMLIVSLLKYGAGWDAPFDALEPVMNRLGAQESLGWNINALILFGPMLAFLINTAALLHFHVYAEQRFWQMEFSIRRSWTNLAVMELSASVILVLALYGLGENCNC